ncbi:MAG: hypothetical protein JWO86_7444 [Myxococcaceae bacterium]|jgi:hypothetical protein|nr:hypothetical protein [Myxococcaceae bacterium]MEA2752647.1 hypothetical protein [Myxococcales bacterium]
MITSKNARSIIGLSSVLALAASSFACSAPAGEESVEPRVETINRSHQALSSGALKWANGTFTGCQNRSGSWSARISGTDPMPHPALTVVKDDVDCTLTLTSLEADATYDGDPSIAMTTSYATSGSAFSTGGGSIAFYANADLSSASFAGNFGMTILFSDDLADTSPTVNATYATVTATASESQVVAPSYALDFGGLTLQTNVSHVVQSASGNVTTTATGQTGESYVISENTSLGLDFADVDAEYALGEPAAVGSSIAIDAFDLGGKTLPVTRTLIIQHAESGVPAYQVVRITFAAPL